MRGHGHEPKFEELHRPSEHDVSTKCRFRWCIGTSEVEVGMGDQPWASIPKTDAEE